MENTEKSKLTLMPMRSDERLAQKIATNILPRYPTNSILDIGCGDGLLADTYQKHELFRARYHRACIYEQKQPIPRCAM